MFTAPQPPLRAIAALFMMLPLWGALAPGSAPIVQVPSTPTPTPTPELAQLALTPVVGGVAILAAQSAMITFEEPINHPETVTQQYCLDPATSKGVEFMGRGGRIYVPPTTSPPTSGTHAFTNQFPGQEFGGTERLQIRFTAGQSQVSARVGLDTAHAMDITARLMAFSAPTPSSAALIKTAEVNLGHGPTPITTSLAVSSSSPNIHSVEIEFVGPGVGIGYPEVIDDLAFSTIGPPCVNDTDAPIVSITKPASDGQVTHSPTLPMGFIASDAGSGIASVRVAYLAGLGSPLQEIESFDYCGGALTLPCGPPYSRVPQAPLPAEHFVAQLPPGTAYVRIEARDFAGHVGHADRQILSQLPGASLNLWLQGVEITQAVQSQVQTQPDPRRAAAPYTKVDPFTQRYYTDTKDAVPLVAGRTTVVRVYPGVEHTDNNVPVDGVVARLKCYLDEGFTQPCPGPAQLEATIAQSVLPTASLTDKRSSAGDSANFVLPADWVKATPLPGYNTGKLGVAINLEASVGVPLSTPECAGCDDLANTLRVSGIQFWRVDHFTLGVPIDLRGYDHSHDGMLSPLDTSLVTIALNYLRQIYPVRENTVPTGVSSIGVYTDSLQTPVDDRCSDFMDFVEGVADQFGGTTLAFIATSFPCSGLGAVGGNYGFAGAGSMTTGAHELGHTFGLLHAGPPPGHGGECKDSDWCNETWPWPHGTTGDFGWDTTNMLPIVPGTTEKDPHDVMAYGGNRWISARNWWFLFNRFARHDADATTGDGGVLDEFEREAQRGPAQALLVRGTILPGDRANLKPIYELEPPAGAARARGTGDYAIDLLDARGQVLATRAFTPQAAHIDDAETGQSRALPPRFSEWVPLAPGTVTVLVRHERAELARLTRSAAPPRLSLLSPTAGGFAGQPDRPVIRWTGSDPDRDALTYLIEYRPEAGPDAAWRTLAIDVAATELAVRLAGLPGGPAAQVRLSATDGFNTTTLVSPAFAVGNKPPTVQILRPAAPATIEQGMLLALRGAAADLEDGVLDDAALAWQSDRDGALGSGADLDVSTLTPGSHTITLTGHDRQGEVGTDTVTVLVTPRVDTQPVAVAGPDQRGTVGTLVQFDGTGSFDADGDQLTYHWRISERPPQSDTPLHDANTPRPSFTPDRPGTYVVELRVTAGKLLSLPDRLTITVGTAGAPALIAPTATGTPTPASTGPATTNLTATPTPAPAGAGPATLTPTPAPAITRPGVPTATSTPTPARALRPTPTPTAAGACPALETPTLQAVLFPGNQVRLTWDARGGCEPLSGTLTAQYADEAAPYASYPVSTRQGVVMDEPPSRCEGTRTINYALILRDSSGQATRAFTVQSVLWLC